MKTIRFPGLLKLLFLTVAFVFWSPFVQAQRQDTAFIDALYRKGKSFRYTNRDSSLIYLKQVEELSKQAHYTRGYANSLYEYGLREKLLYNQFRYFTQALELFESIHDKFGIGICLVKIGSIYSQIGRLEKAQEYFIKALTLKKEINDFGGTALTLIEMGKYYENKAQLEEALRNFEEALVYRLKEGSRQGIAYAQVNIANVYILTKRFEPALVLADSAFQNFSVRPDSIGQLWALDIKGTALLALKRLQEAERIFQAVNSFSKELQYNQYVLHAHEELIRIYSDRGDINKAFKLQSAYLGTRDTLAIRDQKVATQRFVNEYEFEMTEKEARQQQELEQQRLSRRDNIEYLAIAIVVFILFIILFSGKRMLNARLINSFLFIGLLLLFEFLLIVTDPKVDSLTRGEPYLKLLANILLALLVLPAHQFLENQLKKRLVGEKLGK